MFAERMKAKVLTVDRDSMTMEERAVMAILWRAFIDGKGEKVTQAQIAQHERWLGCHPEHEAEVVAVKKETTQRMVRQIIRDLRIKYHMPIVSDQKGYWIPREEQEVLEYMVSLEREVAAQVASWNETLDAMGATFDMQGSAITIIQTNPTRSYASATQPTAQQVVE